MNKRFPALLFAAGAALCLTGCGSGENQTPTERKAKFDSDLLCGFHLTFYDDIEKPIEELNKPLESGEAVASYLIREHREELGGYDRLSGYEGADIFLTVERKISDIKSDNSHTNEIEIEETLFLTCEYTGKYVCAQWLYYNEDTKEISHEDNLYTNVGNSVKVPQNLTAEGVDKNGETYTINYNASVTFNIKRIDCLTGVKILEYGSDNEVIKTTEFINDGKHGDYTPNENCEYVVVEEEYTNRDGGKYRERTLINRDKDDSVILKFPYKAGLAKPEKLNIKW